MRIGVVGCAGRMGKEIIKEILDSNLLNLAGGIVKSSSLYYKKDIGEIINYPATNIIANDDLEGLCTKADVIIEFTNPINCLNTAKIAAKHKIPLVSGTSGLNQDQLQELSNYAKEIPILWSMNMGLGINLITGLLKIMAKKFDDSFDVEILEMHHRHKIDVPSGTALMLGEAIANSKDSKLADIAVYDRANKGKRKKDEIGFSSIRGGEEFGYHEVIFAGDAETIKITHRALNRGIWAKGAVKAALWLKNQPVKLYNMQHMLGINES